ncbi:hypothetical protein SCAR479_03732 [Seiridium cardinale]|uniref:Rhodopsin domain-containing protein n=1 Tax=Seiridium cardinale TaxID=138064 RepID=A0ABR2XZP2_9PEZI
MSGLGPDDNASDMTQGPALLAVSVTTTILALFATILRFCVRIRINRKVVWDDHFLGLAMLLGLVGAILAMVEGAEHESFTAVVQFDYLSQPWLNMASALSKVSICFFFLRLVSRVRVWRIVLGLQVVLLLLINLVYCFTTLLQCRPLEKLWNTSVAGECWSINTQHGIGYLQGAFDVFSGLFIAFFPLMVIQDLGIQRGLRWPFYVLSVMSIAIAMLTIVKTYNISLVTSNDEFSYQVICTILAVTEQNLSIIAANILPIASLFSSRIRPISQALSAAASARENDDAVSILSRASRASRASKMSRSSRRNSSSSKFVLESPSGDSFERLSIRNADGIEVWPMGIIKTVSVEITQESMPDVERALTIGELKRSASREDWDRHL